MKKLRYFVFALFVAMCGLVACAPDQPDENKTGDESPCFTFKIVDVTKTSVTFNITPLSNTPYMVMIIDKLFFDEFASVDEYIADDLAWFEQLAANEDKELSVWLEENLTVGTLIDTEEGLLPDTEYYIYAYHMNTFGEIVSDLEKIEFQTAGYELVEAGFDISVTDITYETAVVGVVPEDTKTPYFVNVLNEEEYAFFGGDEMAYVKQLEALRDYYIGFGKTPEEMIANLCFVGGSSLKFEKLTAGKKYYAYAMTVDEEFMASSRAVVEEFYTDAPEASSLTFQFEVTATDYDHAEGSVTPSNNDPYVCVIKPAESLTWFDTEEAYVRYVIEDLEWWYGDVESALRRGVTDISELDGLQPETEYAIVCFGWNGAATTRIFSHNFSTTKAAGNPDDLVVAFEVKDKDIKHNSLRITAKPSVGAYYFFYLIDEATLDKYVAKEGGKEAAVRAIANEEIDYGAEYFDCSRAEYLSEMGACVGQNTSLFNQLTPSTNYYAYAVAVDIVTGDLAGKSVSLSEPLRTLDNIVSDAKVEFVIDKYYDGSALAELDAAKFNSCKGRAVVPYEVVPNGTAVKWYTMYNSGDYTSWNSEDYIYDELVTYGYNLGAENVSLNRTEGVAVLPYDEDYTFLAIAANEAGNFGKPTLHVVRFSKSGVSPAEEFIASLSASAPLQAAEKSSVDGGRALGAIQRSYDTHRFVNKPSDVLNSKEEKNNVTRKPIGKRHLV